MSHHKSLQLGRLSPSVITGGVLKSLRSSLQRRTFSTDKVSMGFLPLSLALAFTALISMPGRASAATWYVSSLQGQNSSGNGQSWGSAWADMNGINWPLIQPGDSIEIDAGSTANATVVYRAPLNIGKSGAPGKYITIEVTKQTGHNAGFVSLACQNTAINTNNQSYIWINGSHWLPSSNTGNSLITKAPQLSIVGTSSSVFSSPWGIAPPNIYGVFCGPSSQNVILQNIEIKNCLTGLYSWGSSSSSQLMVHDNTYNVLYWQPSVSGPCYLNNSWVFNASPPTSLDSNPSEIGSGIFTEGSQTYNFSPYPNISVTGCILGPGLTQAIEHQGGALFAQNDLILDPSLCGVDAWSSVQLNMITSFMTPLNALSEANTCLNIRYNPQLPSETANYCILYGGSVNSIINTSLGNYNVQDNTCGNTQVISARQVNPNFVSNVTTIPNTASLSQLLGLNFALQPGSPATNLGSGTTSLAQFLRNLL